MGDQFYYELIASRFGYAALVWRRAGDRPPVARIFLPRKKAAIEAAIREEFPGAQPASSVETKGLAGKIGHYLEGGALDFPLAVLDLGVCSPFQRQVLTRLHRIPRGNAVTYGRLAELVGRPGAARAVGTVMAQNPFPPVIPCHRVVRAGGELGGFGGGLPLKEALLKMEGVAFDASGKVSCGCLIR